MQESTPNKKPKNVIYVNLKATHYPLIKKCVKEMGWKVTESKVKNTLFWCDNEGGSELAANLKRYQFYNHFPGMSGIAHKVELSKAMDLMSRIIPNIYNFHPKTFILPRSASELCEYMQSIPFKSKRTFIIKPDTGCQGRGIKLVQDTSLIEEYNDSAVAQQYVEPFLIDGYKFDLRIYALVTSVAPLRLYIHNEGMARFCTEPYKKPKTSNLSDCYSHLTNFSLNKNSENFQTNDTDIAPETGSKRTMTSVFKRISEVEGADVQKLKDRIDMIIRLTLISIQPHLQATYHTTVTANDGKSRCFEILGFDILIDEHLNPWLIEVNTMPSLSTGSPFDEALKRSCVIGAMKIIDLKPSFRKRYNQAMKKYMFCSSTATQICDFNPNTETEIAKETNWRQIYPITDPKILHETQAVLDKAFEASQLAMCRETKASQIRKEHLQQQLIRENQLKTPLTDRRISASKKTGPYIKSSNSTIKVTKKTPNVQRAPLYHPLPLKTVRPASKLADIPLASRPKSTVVKRREDETTVFQNFNMLPKNPVIEAEERDRIYNIQKQINTTTYSSLFQNIKSMLKTISDTDKKPTKIKANLIQKYIDRALISK